MTIAIIGIVPAGASAQEFIYKVAGSKLETGASREIIGSGSKFVFKGELGGETKFEIECAMKLGIGAVIKGGKPGISEETINLTVCKSLIPAGCTKVTVSPIKAKNEIVVLLPSKKLGVLLTPLSGSLTEVKFEGCLGNASIEVTGSVAAQQTPEGTEELKNKLIFPVVAVKKVEKSTKVTVSVGLEVAAGSGTLSGESSLELVSKEIFGIF
jgi:hypothetical protein